MAAVDHLIYAVAWLSFSLLHSILAVDGVKARLSFGRSYRLIYNAFAPLHFAGVSWCGQMILGNAAALNLPNTIRFVGEAVSVAGIVVLLAALSGYDRRRCLGTAQLADFAEPPDEPLRTAARSLDVSRDQRFHAAIIGFRALAISGDAAVSRRQPALCDH